MRNLSTVFYPFSKCEIERNPSEAKLIQSHSCDKFSKNYFLDRWTNTGPFSLGKIVRDSIERNSAFFIEVKINSNKKKKS